MPLPGTDLTTIRTKVRRLTRSPDQSSLTDQQIDDYVNTFILYDLPEHLRLFDLRKTLTFYTAPYIDTYSTVTAPSTSPLFNFKNRYITIHPPVYCAGFEILLSQSREQFYGIYPQVEQIFQIGAGDGVTTNFQFTLTSVPFLQNNVTISSVSTTNGALSVKDVPVSPFDGTGILEDTETGLPAGSINYITGAINVTFAAAPASGVAVNSMTLPYQPARPMAMLFFNNEFTLRPVPDQPYPVNMEVWMQPTALLDAGESPELHQWWQYISYGASVKVFQDRMDNESVALLMPEFKVQERLVLRKTLVQYSNERTATIYTNQTAAQYGPGWFSGGGIF